MERPELTELERLRLENVTLKYNALEAQQQNLVAERIRIIQQIEAAYPGWVWKEQEGLVRPGPVLVEGETEIPETGKVAEA
jgi:hypothetical protein